jgi:hypothetical protein
MYALIQKSQAMCFFEQFDGCFMDPGEFAITYNFRARKFSFGVAAEGVGSIHFVMCIIIGFRSFSYSWQSPIPLLKKEPSPKRRGA